MGSTITRDWDGPDQTELQYSLALVCVGYGDSPGWISLHHSVVFTRAKMGVDKPDLALVIGSSHESWGWDKVRLV